MLACFQADLECLIMKFRFACDLVERPWTPLPGRAEQSPKDRKAQTAVQIKPDNTKSAQQWRAVADEQVQEQRPSAAGVIRACVALGGTWGPTPFPG